MFERLKEKITGWWKNPSWAPVTEPLGMIGRAAYAPNAGFIDGIREGLERRDYGSDKDKPALVRIFKAWNNIDAPVHVSMTAALGSILGALGGGATAGALLAIGGSGVALTAIGVIAGAAVAGVGFPFAVMTALALGGAIVGALGSPLGIAKGCIKAFKFRQAQQAQAAVAQVVPALQQAAPDVKETAAALFRSLSNLPQDLRGPVVKSLAEQFAGGVTGNADRVMQAVDAMPEADREALVRQLQEKLKPTFEAVAVNDAQASITLQEDAPTMHALKLKTRKNAGP